MKIALILLTRNEKDCLEIVFPKIPAPGPAGGYDVMYAVDGGSTDGTQAYYESRGVAVVGQSKRGRGSAFQLAIKNIDADAYIFFSPDGNEDPTDIPKFRAHLEKGADIVIASRMMEGARNEEDGQLLPFRKWVNNIFNFAANILFRKEGPYITDSINGFRAITRAAGKTLKLDANDHTIEYQMTIRGFEHGMKIVEFPTIEGPRVAGEVKAKSFHTGVTFVRAFFREVFCRKSKYVASV